MERKYLVERIDDADWMAALANPLTTVEPIMSGLPFLFVPWEGWDTKDKKLAEHIIYFVVAGQFQCVIEGEKFTLKAGELCWVNPGVRFRFTYDASRPATVQRFRMKVCRQGESVRLKWDSRVFRDVSGSMEWARLLVAEPRPAGPFASQRLVHLAALFSIDVFTGQRSSRFSPALSATACRQIMNHVANLAQNRITPRELAQLVGLSPDYFTRLFRKTFGVSPKEWILQQRLRQAAGLLAESTWTISEISQRMGFSDLYLFSRQFKQEFGNSPRTWRRQQGG